MEREALYSRDEAAEALQALSGCDRAYADDCIAHDLEPRPDGTYWRSDVRDLAITINKMRMARARDVVRKAIAHRRRTLGEGGGGGGSVCYA